MAEGVKSRVVLRRVLSNGVEVADAMLDRPGVLYLLPSSKSPSSANKLCSAAGGLRSLMAVAGDDSSATGDVSTKPRAFRESDDLPFLRRNLEGGA